MDKGWVLLRTVAINAVRNRWAKPVQDVEDFIDERLQYIAEQLRNDLSERTLDGKIKDFEVDDEPSPYLRRLSPRHPTILEKLWKIDPFDFETVCSKILATLGADAGTTQRTNDGGVDFTATKLKMIHATLPMPISCHGIVIGQAKRYKEGAAISETRLREFVGAAILKRHRMVAEHGVGPLTPSLFAFWTTSDLEPNAKKFARSIGLWYMDGSTLSAYAEELGLVEFIEGLPDAK